MGHYRLDVTAFSADKIRGGSATAEFQVASTFSLVGSWNPYRAWFKNINPINRYAADGTFIGWEDYAETIENNNGTWSLTGNTFTETFSHGGPGAGVSLSGTLTWVNANQAQWIISDPPANVTFYRKGFEPDGYLFNNPKYPPMPLVRDTFARGNLPSDGLALYEYVAGPYAQNTAFSLTGGIQLYMYESDQQTFVDRLSKSTENEALTPYQTYYIAAIPGPLASGDYLIAVTENPAYVGTWVNPAYNGNGPQLPGKVVVTVNSVALYVNDTDATPVATFPFTLTGDWTDSGAHYFKLIDEVSPPPSPSYRDALIRLSNNNNTMEANSTNPPDYPAFIGPAGEAYQIFWRQY
jgi:hypothetical protein